MFKLFASFGPSRFPLRVSEWLGAKPEEQQHMLREVPVHLIPVSELCLAGTADWAGSRRPDLRLGPPHDSQERERCPPTSRSSRG
jgi:hypothetical protein